MQRRVVAGCVHASHDPDSSIWQTRELRSGHLASSGLSYLDCNEWLDQPVLLSPASWVSFFPCIWERQWQEAGSIWSSEGSAGSATKTFRKHGPSWAILDPAMIAFRLFHWMDGEERCHQLSELQNPHAQNWLTLPIYSVPCFPEHEWDAAFRTSFTSAKKERLVSYGIVSL
jgi:hypothetical protein